ncbi:MAG: type II toxin-antitoxin system HicB family antitoxin [Pseudomonadota bacterium]
MLRKAVSIIHNTTKQVRCPKSRRAQMHIRKADKVVRFTMSVPVRARKEGNWFYSSCEVLDVHSQGKTKKEAINNLIEALQLFLETCYEEGTFEQVLREQGFVPAHGAENAADERMVEVPLSLIARQHAEARAC